MKLITIFAVAGCVLADEPNGYPTYAPTVYETYAPTRYETYAPTQGDDDEYATDVPTGSDIATLMPVTASPVVDTTISATTATLATTTTTTTVTTTTTTTTTTPAVPVCPGTLDKFISIDDKAKLYYAVVPSNPMFAKNGILCARLEAKNGNGWIALGFSSNGQMVGSEAIVGVPNDGTVLKYNLLSKAQSGVTPMPAEKQTLSDVSISVEDDDVTVMTFTKLLLENDEIPILPKGENAFLHARGADTFGYHYNGRMNFTIDFSEDAKIDRTKNDASESISDNGGNGFVFSEGNAAQIMSDSAPKNGSDGTSCYSFASVLIIAVLGSMSLI